MLLTLFVIFICTASCYYNITYNDETKPCLNGTCVLQLLYACVLLLLYIHFLTFNLFYLFYVKSPAAALPCSLLRSKKQVKSKTVSNGVLHWMSLLIIFVCLILTFTHFVVLLMLTACYTTCICSNCKQTSFCVGAKTYCAYQNAWNGSFWTCLSSWIVWSRRVASGTVVWRLLSPGVSFVQPSMRRHVQSYFFW